MTLAYETTGSGAPLLVVHGITESRRTWDPVVPLLATDHTVVAVDLPGHGASPKASAYDPASMADAVAAVVDELDLPAPVLVGHSLGGVVATAYAAAHRCRGVVSVDQPLALADFQGALRQLEPMLRGDEVTFRTALDLVFASLQGALADEEVRRIEQLREPDRDVVLAIWEPVLDQPAEALDALVRSIGAAVRVPYLALHGSDPGLDYAAWLDEVIPGATLEVWDGVGHYPHLVHPDRFVERLREFERVLPG